MIVSLNINALKACLLVAGGKKEPREQMKIIYIDLKDKTLFSSDGAKALITKPSLFVTVEEKDNKDLLLIRREDLDVFLKHVEKNEVWIDVIVEDNEVFLRSLYQKRNIELASGWTLPIKQVYNSAKLNGKCSKLGISYANLECLTKVAKVLDDTNRTFSIMQFFNDKVPLIATIGDDYAHFLVQPITCSSNEEIKLYDLA